jgi:hypothetical protein
MIYRLKPPLSGGKQVDNRYLIAVTGDRQREVVGFFKETLIYSVPGGLSVHNSLIFQGMFDRIWNKSVLP